MTTTEARVAESEVAGTKLPRSALDAEPAARAPDAGSSPLPGPARASHGNGSRASDPADPPRRLGVAARAVLGSAALLVGAGLLLLVGGSAVHTPAIAAATGAAVGAALVTGALGAAFVIRPLREVTRSALALSAGDLAARAPVHGDDEVSDLSRALNRFAGEHARSLDQLRTERDLLVGILEGMGEGVLVLDADERIVLVNRALRTIARLGDDAVGKPLLEAIRNASLKEALDTARERDEAVVREIELGRPLPRKLLVRVARLAGALPSQPGADGDSSRSAGGNGTIAVFHDVTDLRRLETIRTDFVANVSHELRTPVTAITTATETLLGGALAEPEEAAEFIGVIDRHGKRLRQLVDDLLDLAKLEAKSFRLVLVELDIRPIAAHAISLMEEQARRRRMTLSLAPSSTDVLRARIDRRGLEQVLVNLLDNAIKYAGEGARVTLTTRAKGDRIEIAVSDDGVGISPAHLGRVFERFYRVDAGRSRELGGTGLGLAIVKHLVELMAGTVDVESELGKGATFTIRLPTSPTPSRPSLGP
ncbi:Phosphate regulon sensor protein PhoR (SphS) [Minicystis rosea]|nr:Phosphate regulon sensor protein PhoR (SphS) [Minicystis rosea]